MATTIGLLASLAGFCVAAYIYHKQGTKKPLMCPRNAPCETVLNSPQAKTFGFSNAALGIAYYVIVFFSFLMLAEGGSYGILEAALAVITTAGLAFSFYLVRVQKVIIKQWCVWCMASAAMSALVFLATWLFIFLG